LDQKRGFLIEAKIRYGTDGEATIGWNDGTGCTRNVTDVGFQPHGNVFFHTRNAVVDKQTSLAVQDSDHVVLSVASSMKDWYYDTQSAKVVVPPYPPYAQGSVDEITRT
jgi:hypothetical protein